MSSTVQLIEVPQSFCQQEVEFIQSQLAALFDAEAQIRRLVFDFAKTRVVDSAAIIYLRQLSQQAKAKGVELLGWSLHPQLKQALTLAGVDQHFTFAETTNQLVTDADEPEQGNRLEVKPGLTGEWQVNGRSTVLNFDQVVAMDLNYQKRWSLGYDLKLIFKTIQVVFSKRSGAC